MAIKTKYARALDAMWLFNLIEARRVYLGVAYNEKLFGDSFGNDTSNSCQTDLLKSDFSDGIIDENAQKYKPPFEVRSTPYQPGLYSHLDGSLLQTPITDPDLDPMNDLLTVNCWALMSSASFVKSIPFSEQPPSTSDGTDAPADSNGFVFFNRQWEKIDKDAALGSGNSDLCIECVIPPSAFRSIKKYNIILIAFGLKDINGGDVSGEVYEGNLISGTPIIESYSLPFNRKSSSYHTIRTIIHF